MRRVWSAVTALVMMLASCTYDSQAEPASVSTTDGPQLTSALPEELNVQPLLQLRCAGTRTGHPPDGFEVISEAVALPSSPNHPALQTSRRQAGDGSTFFFAKTGLVFNTASSFELVVPADLRPRLAIGWGGPAPHGHSVTISCSGKDEWVSLPGGYWVTQPLCAELIVRTEGEDATVQIGLGTPCDGQAPPQGPSDS